MLRRREKKGEKPGLIEDVLIYVTLGFAFQFWPIMFLDDWYNIFYGVGLVLLISINVALFVRRIRKKDE